MFARGFENGVTNPYRRLKNAIDIGKRFFLACA